MLGASWNVLAHDDAREGKWRGNWRMEWVTSTLHTTSEHGVSGITTADAHTSAVSSRLNWRPCRFKWTRPFRRKKIWFLRVCHHISNAVYNRYWTSLFYWPVISTICDSCCRSKISVCVHTKWCSSWQWIAAGWRTSTWVTERAVTRGSVEWILQLGHLDDLILTPTSTI